MRNRTRIIRFAAGAALALCLALALAATANADPYAVKGPFDISQGNIIVENGSTEESLRVRYGGAGTFADLVLPDEDIEIIGASTDYSIQVNTTRPARLVLNDVSIDRSADPSASAFSLIPGANVILGVAGENTVTSGALRAGIEVPRTASLEIFGTGGVLSSKGGRDIVLLIDRSGSMNMNTSSGGPTRMAATKTAAINFCTGILGTPGTRIAVVSFADTAIVEIGFSSNITNLTAAISAINAIGGNADPFGLLAAKTLLSTMSNGAVILLSDGVPDIPSDVLDAAQDIKDLSHVLYTIGVSPPSSGKTLLEDCQNGGYYDVTNISDLDGVFDDIGDDILHRFGALTAYSTGSGAGIGGAANGGQSDANAGRITIRGATVKAYSNGYGAGIGGGRGGAGGYFLLDGGTVEAGGVPPGYGDDARDAYGAGVGGGQGGAGGSIAVQNGKLLAYSADTGAGYGAGVGSGSNGANGGSVAIVRTDDLQAYSSRSGAGYGAGIGGGFQSPCGTVVITDHGKVVAKSAGSGAKHGADIGAGAENGNHGNQLILTNSIGGDYLVGHVTLSDAIESYTVSAADKLIIPAGASLTIPAGVTLVNDGIIENYGALNNNSKLVNNGRIDNFAVLRNNGQFIRNPGSFFNDDPAVGPPVTPADDTPSWSTPGESSWRELRAADDALWTRYSLSGSAASLYLTPDKAMEIVACSEDGTADIDLTDVGGLTEVSLPKAALAYFAGEGLDVEFRMPLGAVRLNRAAATDIAKQGDGTQLYIRLLRVQTGALNAARQASLQAGDVVYELALDVDGQNLSGFNGAVTVTVPYTEALPAGAWYLDENGRREKAESAYENGFLRFTTRRVALFAVGRAGASAEEAGGLPWYYVN